MEYRKFGKTDLMVSSIGFGAWGIGGPAMAGDIPIGWGTVDDHQSIAALQTAFDRGINFYDTANFYGLGHSEELIGNTFGNREDIIIATKVGHRLKNDGSIFLDYSKKHILEACNNSLKRLKRDHIDYYQLHSARMEHLRQGECIEAMEQLQNEGKIRYWGLSLNTFHPEPEADFLIKNQLCHGFQIVFNIINQRGLDVIKQANKAGYGIIARMPLQFGLLTGKFNRDTRFDDNDHRAFRLPPPLLSKSLDALEPIWEKADEISISKTALALSYILSYAEVSTVIPGIKTPEQAKLNTTGITRLSKENLDFIQNLYHEKFAVLMELMEKQG